MSVHKREKHLLVTLKFLFARQSSAESLLALLASKSNDESHTNSLEL